MTSLLCNYPAFEISSDYELPNELRQILKQVWSLRYEELYEEVPDNIILENSFSKILETIQVQDQNLYNLKYVYIALTLGLAVEPTIKAYLPEDIRPQQIIQTVKLWLKTKEKLTQNIGELFPTPSVGNQAIDEAIDVFKNLLTCLELESAQKSLLSIFDNCFEGYAIFPGSEGRRDLFNWWLLEVVPAAWCLQLPKTIYTIQGIIRYK